eukprot:43193-Eustigmatos_ZCMA.PRE.1
MHEGHVSRAHLEAVVELGEVGGIGEEHGGEGRDESQNGHDRVRVLRAQGLGPRSPLERLLRHH